MTTTTELKQITICISGRAKTGLLAKLIPIIQKSLRDSGYEPKFSQSELEVFNRNKISRLHFGLEDHSLTPFGELALLGYIKKPLQENADRLNFSFVL